MRHPPTITLNSGQRQSPVGVLAAVASAVAIAACGSSGPSPSGAGSGRAAQGIKFADCMRANGVPNLPDPSSGGGLQIPAGSGIDPQSPAFRSAQAACAKLQPFGGPGSQHPNRPMSSGHG